MIEKGSQKSVSLFLLELDAAGFSQLEVERHIQTFSWGEWDFFLKISA